MLLDRFLDDAVELDVDAVCDGERVLIGGIMEHIEQAGVHSGDSACSLPPHGLSRELQARVREQMGALARRLDVVGLVNAQFAIKDEDVYVLEVNPRASRTVPFVSKATGLSLARIAARCMVGQTLEGQGVTVERTPRYYSVKEAVFPFVKFQGVDPLLGPEMKSTGEVMGVGRTFGEAFGKAWLAAGERLPAGGQVFISVRDVDKKQAVDVAMTLSELDFTIVATSGTAAALSASGVACRVVNKVTEGRPHVVDMIKNDEIELIVNTTEGKQAIADSYAIRRTALKRKVAYTAGAKAMTMALREARAQDVNRLQELHEELTE